MKFLIFRQLTLKGKRWITIPINRIIEIRELKKDDGNMPQVYNNVAKTVIVVNIMENVKDVRISYYTDWSFRRICKDVCLMDYQNNHKNQNNT